MKIIIEHKGVKRQIEGTGFNICGSHEQLEIIKNALETAVMSGLNYGWVQIRDHIQDEHQSLPNTEARGWDA